MNHLTKSESINELATALAKAQGKMKAAEKDSLNPHFKSKFASFSSIVDAAKASLSENGLSYLQLPGLSEGYVIVTTVLMHASGQWVSGELKIKPSQESAQPIGSAITYAKRYALAAILGIPTDEEDDGGTPPTKRAASAFDPLLPTHMTWILQRFEEEGVEDQELKAKIIRRLTGNLKPTTELETILKELNLQTGVKK